VQPSMARQPRITGRFRPKIRGIFKTSMKKLISIEDLKSGMFLEADVVDEVVDGETVSFLGARDAVSKGAKGKRAKLTGRMNTRVQRDGGGCGLPPTHRSRA